MLKIKLNLLGLDKTVNISGGANNVIKVGQLNKVANGIALVQLKLGDLKDDDVEQMLTLSNDLIDAEGAFINAVTETLTDVIKLTKKEVDKVMDDTPVDDLIAFASYVFGRMNGASEESLAEAPKE